MKGRLGSFWILLFLFFGLGVLDSIVPLLLIIGAVVFVTVKAVESSKSNTYTSGQRNSGIYRANNRQTQYRGVGDRKHTADQKAIVNTYLLKRYRLGKRSFGFTSGKHSFVLKLTGNRFTSLDNLQIECDGHNFDTVQNFRISYSALYDQLFDNLLTMARTGEGLTGQYSEPVRKTTSTVQEKPQPVKKKASSAEDFRIEINDLNNGIPDPEITNGLYETVNLLKTVGDLETNFPDQKSKLEKLYKTYLPYMISILSQYTKMQNVQTDPNYEENVKNLKMIINRVNVAMKEHIIPSMSENSSINLQADIDTLEAMLRKDGLTGDDMMRELRKQESGK